MHGLILVLVTALAAAAPTPAAPAEASIAQERIAQLETAWNGAHLHGDVEALDRLWAPDITVIVPGMRPFKKADLLAMWRSMKVVFTDYSTSDVAIRVYGTTAIVTGRVHRSRDFGGRAATDDWLFTKAYALTDGQWRVVAYHASVPPG
jgi:uncharacterized protein (TIGR02246 family)